MPSHAPSEDHTVVRPAYHAFLLRCWQHPGGAGRPVGWRYEVREVAAASEPHTYSDWLELTDFIVSNLRRHDSGEADGEAAVRRHRDP